MMNIKVHTEKVSGHKDNGMPVIEKIDIDFCSEANYEKFLKYLPYQRYILEKLRIIEVTENDVRLHVGEWEKRLSNRISEIDNPVPEKKTSNPESVDILVKENKELNERLEKLEKLLTQGKEPNKEDSEAIKEAVKEEDDDVSFEELKVRYIDKFNKKPYYGWDKSVLIQKLKENE